MEEALQNRVYSNYFSDSIAKKYNNKNVKPTEKKKKTTSFVEQKNVLSISLIM